MKSIACKRNITLVNIHSTRMLMAHGFLRRIFEVFDRHETPVDMVATCEVSVSLTIDNTAQTEANLRGTAASFPKSRWSRIRRSFAWSAKTSATRRAWRARVSCARRRQHPHDFAGRVAAESERRGGRKRSAARRGSAAHGIFQRTRSRGFRDEESRLSVTAKWAG